MPVNEKTLGKYFTRPWVSAPSASSYVSRPLIFKIINLPNPSMINEYLINLTQSHDTKGYGDLHTVTYILLPYGISIRPLGRSRIDGNWMFYMIRDEKFINLRMSIPDLIRRSNLPGLTGGFSVELISMIEDHIPGFNIETFLNVDEPEETNFEEWKEE